MTSNGPESYQRHRGPDPRSPVFEKWGVLPLAEPLYRSGIGDPGSEAGMTSNGPDSYQRHRAPDARSPVFEKWGVLPLAEPVGWV